MEPVSALQDATEPPERRGIDRDAVRLLVTRRANRTHEHRRFYELPALLERGDLLVVNDSATVPAALIARRANGDTIALHVATPIDERLWIAEPRTRAVLVGEELTLPGGGSAAPIAPLEPDNPRLWYVRFHLPAPMYEYLRAHGEPIRYGYVTERFPLDSYQTMFASEPGSAEMASAARPFTPRVVRSLRARGVEIATVTLHCGVSSFEAPERPGPERFFVPRTAAEEISRAKTQSRRVIAAGTTALRAIETAAARGEIAAGGGWTSLVIDAQYKLRAADGLLTGFHHGSSTHQWILRAFMDPELLADSYEEAASLGYYQHEFGDVQLIL